MDLSEVGVSCRACRERDLLPITCDVCCWSYCRAHSAPADHQCVAEPADVLSIDQSHDACRRLATLMTRTVIPNAKANADTKFRTLSLHSKALAFLPDVRGGLALLQSFGWSRVGDFLTLGVAQPGEDVLDWRKSLDRQERHFTQLLRQLGEKAPGSSKRVKQDFEFFLVLDFEATCQDGPEKIKPQEIIELPVVLVDAATLRVVAEFHSYIRPVVHPKLTPFCTSLTGIAQATVDAAQTADAVFASLEQWLVTQQLVDAATRTKSRKWTFASCGDWDLRTALPNQFKLFAGRQQKLPSYFESWINIKIAFAKMYKGRSSSGMAAMLTGLGLPLIGRHHSGIDDARNIAAILVRMLHDGYHAQLTTWRTK